MGLVDQEALAAMEGQEGQMDTDHGTIPDQEDQGAQEAQVVLGDPEEDPEDPEVQDTPQADQEDPDSLSPEALEIHTDHPMVEEHGTTTCDQSKARRTCFPVCLHIGGTA